MTCPQCHTENPAGSRFCHKCGAALALGTATGAAVGPSTAPPSAAPGAGVAPIDAAHPHFAPTAKVLLVGAGVVALLFVLILGAGATFVIRAARQHTVAQAGGIRPITPQNPAPGPGGQPSPATPAQPPVAPTLPPPPPAPAGVPPSAPTPPPPAPAGPGAGAVPTPIPVPPPQGGGSGQPGQSTVAMQRYHGSNGAWGIDYPQGWQVREAPSTGTVVFFQDDPDEGTAFSVIPWGTLQGEGDSKAVLTTLAAAVRRQYPDFKVSVVGSRDVSQAGTSAQMLDADAAWTGAKGQAMRGAISLIVIGNRGSGMTNFIFLGGQAPAPAFNGMRPVFTQMTQSLGGQ
ncbi:MAG: zinc ribbon domain-containing protein [bacterium]